MRMNIRRKLLLLLLAIALVPLIAGGGVHSALMKRLGEHLASRSRQTLLDNARSQLKRLIDDYTRILQRDKKALEHAVQFQAREVERRLAIDVPEARRLYFSRDYDGARELPEGMRDSARHFRSGPDGERAPIPVTYREQVYFVPRGVDPDAIAADLARLATMPEAYDFTYRSNPELMYWQYTSLQSGFHTSYPGHGGYPPEYDPRTRKWYQDARDHGSVTWIVMPEVSTRTVALTVATPVRRPDGAFAGVTAIDVPLLALFEGLDLPAQWAAAVHAMLVIPDTRERSGPARLAILAQKSYEDLGAEWKKPVEMEYLHSMDVEKLEALTAGALSGASGVRRLRYRGKDALWAYGSGDVFPVIVLPYDLIIADALEAEQYALTKTVAGLKATGAILLIAAVVVALVAFSGSRSVTRPVSRLAEAARRLAGGDFATRVTIRTGDELQDLGDVFNGMGPQLKEGERMRQSLTLAMRIQQQLLPQEPLYLAGFQIFGNSAYCDETGGDYYDFIELVDLGPRKVGIAVGDVSGHGIAAALLMASARGVLRSHAARHGTDIEEVFRAVNLHLVRDSPEERFMTLFYGVLDAEARTLQWISAGQEGALCIRAEQGRIEELAVAGRLPLGILADEVYNPSPTLNLESGDVIVIGTDGIWETAGPSGAMFGKERLHETLLASHRGCAKDIHDAGVHAVRRFAGDSPQEDDLPLVVVKTL